MNSGFNSAELMPIVSVSSVMRSLETLLRHLVLSSVPVLFVGEKGTGRAYFARYLHRSGNKADKPFVRLISKDLTTERFEQALAVNPGMVFIDEVADASLEIQQMLLEIVSSETSENSCRICCSTSENLEEKAAHSKFSSELYYRLAVLPVHVPALRERADDIPQLAQIFLSVYSKRYNKRFSCFSDEALNSLINAYWPQNFLEFESCIERACAIAAPPVIEKEDLRLNILGVSGIFTSTDKSLKTAVDQFKKQYITQILAEVRWNQTEAAKVLNIQRTYLSRLIKELNIK